MALTQDAMTSDNWNLSRMKFPTKSLKRSRHEHCRSLLRRIKAERSRNAEADQYANNKSTILAKLRKLNPRTQSGDPGGALAMRKIKDAQA